MDEEKMWKDFYDKLQEQKMNPPTEHEYRLQDADGGFFEKFGSLLRQKTVTQENDLKTSLEPFADESSAEFETTPSEETAADAESSEEMDCAALHSMGLEGDLNMNDIKDRKEEFFEKSVGMNKNKKRKPCYHQLNAKDCDSNV